MSADAAMRFRPGLRLSFAWCVVLIFAGPSIGFVSPAVTHGLAVTPAKAHYPNDGPSAVTTPAANTRGATFRGYDVPSASSRPRIAVSADRRAAKAAPGPPNRIYSARELRRRAAEPGPYHNFPESFNDEIFERGTRTVTPGFFKSPRANLSSDSVQYRLRGEINNRPGTYEVFARPSQSGRTEVITHRFFRPDPR